MLIIYTYMCSQFISLFLIYLLSTIHLFINLDLFIRSHFHSYFFVYFSPKFLTRFFLLPICLCLFLSISICNFLYFYSMCEIRNLLNFIWICIIFYLSSVIDCFRIYLLFIQQSLNISLLRPFIQLLYTFKESC